MLPLGRVLPVLVHHLNRADHLQIFFKRKRLSIECLENFQEGGKISIALPSGVLARSKDLVISTFNRSLGIVTVMVLDLGFLVLLQL